jgi:sugar/nucleoside kinase (ribokinase family)
MKIVAMTVCCMDIYPQRRKKCVGGNAKAVPVEHVVDTTGCGDAYQAAFTVAWFKNKDIQAAMEAGSMAASDVLSHLGGNSRY